MAVISICTFKSDGLTGINRLLRLRGQSRIFDIFPIHNLNMTNVGMLLNYILSVTPFILYFFISLSTLFLPPGSLAFAHASVCVSSMQTTVPG